MRRRLTAWTARGIRLTHLVDRAYRTFDRLRSAAVLSLANDRFFDEYNALTYSDDTSYRPDSPDFREGLFDWEEIAIGRYFPPPPARVLVGGAGGGREAFGLIGQGYSVVAFDPASALVRGMLARAPSEPRLRAYRGSYGNLPKLETVSGDSRVINLAEEAPFDAAIVGWTSFSHVRSDAERVETLRQFAAVTDGPILVSYLPDPAAAETAPPANGLRRWVWQRMRRRGPSVFSVHIGYCRLLRHRDLEAFVRQAGLKVLGSEAGGSWPYVVVRRSAKGGV